MQSSSSAERCGRVRLSLAALLAAAGASMGCSPACDTSDEGNPPEIYGSGTATDGVYESSPWKRGLLPFPGGKQYQLEHRLGFTPAAVNVYIAFGDTGERVSPCAGNSCVVLCTNSQFVWIKNDTCAEFWVRVVTTGRSSEDLGSLCAGGTPPTALPDGSTGDDSAPEEAAAP